MTSPIDPTHPSRTFRDFVDSERAGGLLLVACTVVSMVVANSLFGGAWVGFWHAELVSGSVEHWVNDGLMAVFFLLIGLELERELYVGELSDVRNAMLPVLAAAGGAFLPMLIHFALN